MTIGTNASFIHKVIIHLVKKMKNIISQNNKQRQVLRCLVGNASLKANLSLFDKEQRILIRYRHSFQYAIVGFDTVKCILLFKMHIALYQLRGTLSKHVKICMHAMKMPNTFV